MENFEEKTLKVKSGIVEYIEKLEQQEKRLKTVAVPIYLFGAMAVGLRAKIALESIGRTVTAFCDNDKRKQGNELEGIRILSPENAYEENPNADIFICLLNPKNVNAVEQQLKELGFRSIYSVDVLQIIFQISYIKREITINALAETMYRLKKPKEFLSLGTIGISTGTFCTLNCRDCIAQIPHMKKKEHYDKDIIIAGMKRLSECTDAIEAFHIVGGEPFLYPWLAEICEVAAKVQNVERITIFTNGMVIPKEEVLQRLRRCVTSIRISHYTNLNYSIQPFIDLLNKHGIVYEIDETSVWTKHSYPEYKGLLDGQLCEIYEKCYWKTQPGLRDGKLRWCSFSESISPFFSYEGQEKDCVDILQQGKDTTRIREEIKKFQAIPMLNACNYCDAYMMKPAERGAQRI